VLQERRPAARIPVSLTVGTDDDRLLEAVGRPVDSPLPSIPGRLVWWPPSTVSLPANILATWDLIDTPEVTEAASVITWRVA